MTEPLYNTRILRLAAEIPLQARLETPQASVQKVSPICGSRVTVDLDLDEGGRVKAFGQEVRACALGQASASLLGERVMGQSADELAAARDALRLFLGDEDGALPAGWEDYEIFAPARPHKARHPSILLALEAVTEAAESALTRNRKAAAE